MCLVLVGLCIEGMGQKLNVISVSKTYRVARLTYFQGDKYLYADTPNLTLTSYQGKLLLLDPKEYPAELDHWMYQLDPDILSHIDSNYTPTVFNEEYNDSTLFFDLERDIKINNVELNIENKGLEKSLDSLRSISVVEAHKDVKTISPPTAPTYTGSAGVPPHSIEYGGSGPETPKSTLYATYDEKVTRGRYSIKVEYVQSKNEIPTSYFHTFRDAPRHISGLSEYQMDVNSYGELVYLRHFYSHNGQYLKSQLTHITPYGNIVYDEYLGFIANKNSFLVKFDNDSILTIMGAEKYAGLVFCRGTYNTRTHEVTRERIPLSHCQLVGIDKTKLSRLNKDLPNHIMGYRTDHNGTYVFLTKNDEKKIPHDYNYWGTSFKVMVNENRRLSYLTKKRQMSKLGSITESFYIIKLDTTNSVDWINRLNFSSICISNIATGENFPILFNTQDPKWANHMKNTPRRIWQGVGMPMTAMVTPEGVKYVETSYDLMRNGFLILTKSHQLDNGEYVGFGAKLRYLRYDVNADGLYNMGVTWHVVRFEVSE